MIPAGALETTREGETEQHESLTALRGLRFAVWRRALFKRSLMIRIMIIRDRRR